MPLGTAHEASAPACSRRRSQCRRVAWCSWTTKRPAAAGSPPAAWPAGSFVLAKSRLAREAASFSFAMGRRPSAVAVQLLVGLPVFGGVVLLFARLLLAHADLDLGLGRPVLGVLDELLLGHLEALGLAAAALVDGIHRGVVGEVLLEVARRAPADVSDLARGRLGLLLGEGVVLVGHLSAPDLMVSARPTRCRA